MVVVSKFVNPMLPGLEIALLEEAFQRSRQMNHGKVSACLLTQFQPGKITSSVLAQHSALTHL
jgi:hypothetical protein